MTCDMLPSRTPPDTRANVVSVAQNLDDTWSFIANLRDDGVPVLEFRMGRRGSSFHTERHVVLSPGHAAWAPWLANAVN